MKTTTPGSIGGMKVAIAWPNMWLSGRRFRKRIGANGRLHFRCFRISRSTGTMFARMLRWVMTTPLGSAVAPDVKMISATSSRDTEFGTPVSGVPSGPVELVQLPDRDARRIAGRDRRHVLADQQELRRDDAADAREKVRRRAVVDRHDDDAAEQTAPEGDDPLRTVLAPEDDLVAFPEPQLVQAGGEAACGAPDLFVCVGAARNPSS